MSYLTPDQLNDGNSDRTLLPGTTANVVLTEYTPFNFGQNKDKVMPQHKGKNADSGEELTFTGFAFHEAVKGLNDAIVPGNTVIRVECLDNGTKYPDYSLSIVTGAAGAAATIAAGQAF